jgi:hypothetical protein
MIDVKNEKLEIYKLYVHMSDLLSTKRNQSNVYFVTITSGILVAYSFILEKNILSEHTILIPFLIGILGLTVCFLWRTNIISYKILSQAKFKVIHEMEKDLAFMPYTDEWKQIQNEKSIHYKVLTTTESYIPFLLALPFFTLLIMAVMNYFH